MKKNKQSESNGLRKAAILLTILGDEAAGAIYRELPEEDVQQLTQEIVELDYISPEQASQVLEDYHRLSLTQEYLAQGGTAYAAQLLVKAFGKESAKSLLAQVEETQEARSSNLDSLRRADPQQLAKFMESEHPQTVALVLAHLGVQHAVGLLKLLPHEMQAQVVAGALGRNAAVLSRDGQNDIARLAQQAPVVGRTEPPRLRRRRGRGRPHEPAGSFHQQVHPGVDRARQLQAGFGHPQRHVYLRGPVDRARRQHPRTPGPSG